MSKHVGTKPKRESMSHNNRQHVLICGTDEEIDTYLDSLTSFAQMQEALRVLVIAVRYRQKNVYNKLTA